jgi:hypothetical protein
VDVRLGVADPVPVTVGVGVGGVVPHDGNLNEPMRVCQSKPVAS